MRFEDPWNVQEVRDCYFYHSIDLPGIGIIDGDWDLIGDFDDYIGQLDLSGKRILDVGTASGFLTFEAEKRGAQVVSFDVQDGRQHQRLPFRDNLFMTDYQAWLHDRNQRIRKLKNSYWLAHRLLRSRADVLYGDVYALPDELGTFDVVLVGQVLVHLRDGISALSSIAQRSHDLVVIVEHVINDHSCWGKMLGKAAMPDLDYSFWHYSLGFYREILGMLGFEIIKVSTKSYRRNVPGLSRLCELTTVVGHKLPKQYRGMESADENSGNSVRLTGLAFLKSPSTAGFGNIEGPYPELGMPRPVVWMTGATGHFSLSCSKSVKMSLHVRVQTHVGEQEIRILLNGKLATEVPLNEVGQWKCIAVEALELAAGSNSIDFIASRHLKTPDDPRELYLLFEEVELREVS